MVCRYIFFLFFKKNKKINDHDLLVDGHLKFSSSFCFWLFCFQHLFGEILTREKKCASVLEMQLRKSSQSFAGVHWVQFKAAPSWQQMRRHLLTSYMACLFFIYKFFTLETFIIRMVLFENKYMMINDCLRPTRWVCGRTYALMRTKGGVLKVWNWWRKRGFFSSFRTIKLSVSAVAVKIIVDIFDIWWPAMPNKAISF